MDLVDRYVNQVGRYLPPKNRAEIEAELRSQIQDQLEDRYQGSPSQAEIASVLTALGDPRKMAVSYGSQQYLIGPDLYPSMMAVLRYGWVLVPVIMVVVSILEAILAEESTTLPELLIEVLLSVPQATFVFSAAVVLIFALLEHFDEELDISHKPFDPLDLPAVDDPGALDHFEAAFGIAFGMFMNIILVYFWQVGGLTLRFDWRDPGEVIPVPEGWLLLFILASVLQIGLVLWVVHHHRWTFRLLFMQTVLELLSVVCGYFVFVQPLVDYLVTNTPELGNRGELEKIGITITLVSASIILLLEGFKLLKLWNYHAVNPLASQMDT
ncbi:MAG: hypothetical protein K8I82_17525 [Anaerolineae bacterium]|nr:hypothetical protein [Anaerolineae bacterium]